MNTSIIEKDWVLTLIEFTKVAVLIAMCDTYIIGIWLEVRWEGRMMNKQIGN